MAMQFVVAAATHKKTKYFPRHFHAVAGFFGDLDWRKSVADATPGNCTIVVRSPGYHGLNRALARKMGMECAFDLLSAEELDFVRNQSGRILVDLGWEMLSTAPDVVAGLADTLAELSIDPTRVFIFHSNQSARHDFNQRWLERSDRPPPFTIEFPVAMALCVIYQQKHRNDADVAAAVERAEGRTRDGSRSKLFTSFNGEVRPHRLYVGAVLESLGLLDRGYFSLIYPRKSRNETQEEFRARTQRIIDKMPRGPEFIDAASRILDRLPMELDLAAIPPGGIEEIAWVSQSPKFYDDSRFTIVIDTIVSGSDTLFVTEKVLKPIMNHSPFLLIGSPRAADLLRSYGFMTFEPHIRQCESDSFDDVMIGAVDEIVRISKLSEAELQLMSEALWERCAYNARHFWDVFPNVLKHKFEECVLAIGPASEAGRD